MERLTVTPEQQAIIDAFKVAEGSSFAPVPAEGTNLVEGDHLLLDNGLEVVVIAGQGGCVASLIPVFGDLILPLDCVDYVVDRAGPDGQTMPIFDEQQLQARTAAKAGAANPKDAARAERKDDKAERRNDDRGLKHMLSDAIKRLPNDKQKHAREVLRTHGVLGKDD